MTCIWEGHAKSKFCSPSPAGQGGEQREERARPMGRGASRMGRGARPQLFAFLALGCLDGVHYFLSPQFQPSPRPVHPPSFPRQPATPARQGKQHNLQSRPSPASSFATSDLDVGCLVEADRGSIRQYAAAPSNKHTLARCVPTFAFTTTRH